MIGLIQKILLTIISVAISLFLFFALYMLLFEDRRSFKIEMLLPVSYAIFGALSFIYHLKTLSLYKKNSIKKAIEKIEQPFFLLNIIFASGLILAALVFFYQFYKVFTEQLKTEYWPFIVVIILPIVIGVWTLLDARFLFNKIKTSKTKSVFDQIDDIKGNDEN